MENNFESKNDNSTDDSQVAYDIVNDNDSVSNIETNDTDAPESHISGNNENRWIRTIYDWIESLVIATVSIVLVFTFLVRIVGVNGPSMQPTLYAKDALMISNFFYEPKFGDIVVTTQQVHINSPEFNDDKTHPLVKRIIGVSGDIVDIDYLTNTVYINGKPIEEPYINTLGDSAFDPMYPEGDIELPIEVPEGFIFVMGDNRNHSTDSRSSAVGLIDKRYILGKLLIRVMPIEKIGPVR